MVDMLEVRPIRGCCIGHDRQAGDDDTLLCNAMSRAVVTGSPLLLGPSPEMSITRREPRYGFCANSGTANVIALEIEVREPRRIGAWMISVATASAASGRSICRQGTTIFWSFVDDHSK